MLKDSVPYFVKMTTKQIFKGKWFDEKMAESLLLNQAGFMVQCIVNDNNSVILSSFSF